MIDIQRRGIERKRRGRGSEEEREREGRWKRGSEGRRKEGREREGAEGGNVTLILVEIK